MSATLPPQSPAGVSSPAPVVVLDDERARLGAALQGIPNPADDLDRTLLCLYPIFAQLPADVLRQIIDFGRYPDSPPVLWLRNLPVDPELPPTPTDGGPSRDKGTFVSECCLLGLSQLLGEPVGVTTEKAGGLIHDIIPVASGRTAQSNQGSGVFLNFHNDIVHDRGGIYTRANPDFLVLVCVRPDPAGEAETMPEVSVSANGVEFRDPETAAAFDRLQEVCRDPSVSRTVQLRRGEALLINNRKGLHARSEFEARYDGADRWLQRTYVRRSLWDIRDRRVAPPRVH